MMSYDIEIDDGCCQGCYVNNEPLPNIPREDVVVIVSKLIDSADKDTLDDILVELVKEQGQYFRDENPCEVCGEHHEDCFLTVEIP